MRQRVGVDLVPLSRVSAMLTPDSRPVLARMLLPEELLAATRAGRLDPSAVAGRLAAKEAVFKLFHAGDATIPWRSIHVTGKPETAPTIRLDGIAADLARDAGIRSEIAVSISHDGDYAIAVAATTTD
jgi:holo-[acyl-carrier protein] synthase